MHIGDYVRTKSYGIAKILNTYNNTTINYSSITLDIIDCFGRLGVSLGNNDIIKSSPNIIDLIEVGDYVNGMRVKDINDVGGFVMVNTSSISENTIFSYNINSIVTKEQFESMEYKVGE